MIHCEICLHFQEEEAGFKMDRGPAWDLQPVSRTGGATGEVSRRFS